MITKTGYFIINGNIADGLVSFPDTAAVEEFLTSKELYAEALARGIIDALPDMPSVPKFITPAQFRIIAYRHGYLSAIEQMVLSDKELEIWFEYATAIERDNALLNQLCLSLGLNTEEIDNLFVEAGKIT